MVVEQLNIELVGKWRFLVFSSTSGNRISMDRIQLRAAEEVSPAEEALIALVGASRVVTGSR